MSERVNVEKKTPAPGPDTGAATTPANGKTASGSAVGGLKTDGLKAGDKKAGGKKAGDKKAGGKKAVAAAKTEALLPALGPLGMLRWAWTQLTSMRTALFLLLLLAVAAVPGSLFPQRPANPSVVTQYIKDHPDYGKILDSLQ
ncbi:MAG: cytochrome c biosis protein, partial [Arthrobacter sp.]